MFRKRPVVVKTAPYETFIPTLWEKAHLDRLQSSPLYLLCQEYHSGIRGWLEHHLSWLFRPTEILEPNPAWWKTQSADGSEIGDTIHIPHIPHLVRNEGEENAQTQG